MTTGESGIRRPPKKSRKKPAQHLPFPRQIGRIANRRVEPTEFFHDAFFVRKGAETGLAMVAPAAAVAHSAEGKPRIGQVHQAIVDAAAAKGKGV